MPHGVQASILPDPPPRVNVKDLHDRPTRHPFKIIEIEIAIEIEIGCSGFHRRAIACLCPLDCVFPEAGQSSEIARDVTQPEAVDHALGMVLFSLCLGVLVRKQKDRFTFGETGFRTLTETQRHEELEGNNNHREHARDPSRERHEPVTQKEMPSMQLPRISS
jgi:hypothetical protein